MGEATVSSCAAFLLRFSICGFHWRLLGLRTAGDSLPEVLPELSDTVRAIEDREELAALRPSAKWEHQ